MIAPQSPKVGAIKKANAVMKYRSFATADTAAVIGEYPMKNRRILLDLILTFIKIGLFTFGGGYAMIALMDNECVEKKQWITHDEFMDVTVIAESTPGPIAINGATYIGYQQAGFMGAVLATIGIVLPSFVILYLISLFFDNLLEITVVASAFKGIKIAVGVLILNAAIKMVKKMRKKTMPVAIMLCSLAASLYINLFALRFSTIYLILIAALFSFTIFVAGKKRHAGGGNSQ
jgi:chromate transporter